MFHTLFRRNRSPLTLLPLVVLVMAVPAEAQYNRTAQLLDAPTAAVLPAGAVLIGTNGTQRLANNQFNPGPEGDLNIRLGVVRGLDLAVSAYTYRDYALNLSYQLLAGQDCRPAVALGIHEISFRQRVSTNGSDRNCWPDEQYDQVPKEAFSAFAVASLPLGQIGQFHIGVGRGRYVGYGKYTRYLNTDCFFNVRHQWAVGLFGGLELNLFQPVDPDLFLPRVALAAEFDGRDLNVGIKGQLGSFSAALGLNKIEGLIAAEKFQRISLGLAYQLDGLLRRTTQPVQPVTRPLSGTVVGKVIDEETGLPLSAAVTRATGEKLLADEHGDFLLGELPPGEELLTVEREGYVSQQVKVAVAAGATSTVIIRLVPEMASVSAPQALAVMPTPEPKLKTMELRLAPIYFEFDKSTITTEARRILDDHAQTLKAVPDVRIIILGYTDDIGTDEYNLRLGERRARAAFDYLCAAGISPQRMSYRSMGRVIMPSKPRWQNRRCEFLSNEQQ